MKVRPYRLWTMAEKKRILREYDKAERGWKWEVLEAYDIRTCHIYTWREIFDGTKRTRKKK